MERRVRNEEEDEGSYFPVNISRIALEDIFFQMSM